MGAQRGLVLVVMKKGQMERRNAGVVLMVLMLAVLNLAARAMLLLDPMGSGAVRAMTEKAQARVAKKVQMERSAAKAVTEKAQALAVRKVQMESGAVRAMAVKGQALVMKKAQMERSVAKAGTEKVPARVANKGQMEGSAAKAVTEMARALAVRKGQMVSDVVRAMTEKAQARVARKAQMERKHVEATMVQAPGLVARRAIIALDQTARNDAGEEVPIRLGLVKVILMVMEVGVVDQMAEKEQNHMEAVKEVTAKGEFTTDKALMDRTPTA